MEHGLEKNQNMHFFMPVFPKTTANFLKTLDNALTSTLNRFCLRKLEAISLFQKEESVLTKSSFSSNRINLIRLACSIFVLLSHLDWLAGNSADHFRRLGIYAVAIFFGLSGFLLTESILRSGANKNFIRNRFLRIFPGYISILLVTSFIFAPLEMMIKKREIFFAISFDNVAYVIKNLTTYIFQPGISNTLEINSVTTWNPSLWTLSYEIVCYAFLFILIKSFGNNYYSIIRYALPFLITAYFLSRFYDFQMRVQFSFTIYYCSFFILGSFLYFWNIKKNKKIVFLLFLLFCAHFFIPRSSNSDFFDGRDYALGLILIPLALIFSFNPKVVRTIKNDYSFGIYIYAAPISQLLVSISPRLGLNWALFASCTLAATFIFALISWHFIERPALKLKKISRLS